MCNFILARCGFVVTKNFFDLDADVARMLIAGEGLVCSRRKRMRLSGYDRRLFLQWYRGLTIAAGELAIALKFYILR